MTPHLLLHTNTVWSFWHFPFSYLFFYSFFFYPLQVWHRISNKVRAKWKRKHKVLETQKHEHPKTRSYIPFLAKVGCIQDVSLRLQPSKQKVMNMCVYCFRIFCSVVFMFLAKSLLKIKKVHIHQNIWCTKTGVINSNTTGNIQIKNSTTHKTYVQSHITHVEPYTVKLTIQITSINTRFNITIICLFFFCCCQTAPIHIPNSSSKACRILQCKDKWPWDWARVVTVSTGMTYTLADTVAGSQSSNGKPLVAGSVITKHKKSKGETAKQKQMLLLQCVTVIFQELFGLKFIHEHKLCTVKNPLMWIVL